VIHRDLKPQNIMMNKRGQLVIMDFGLAAIVTDVTGSEAQSGTPAYMSPEQLKGIGVTAKSDLYALGMVLYELFTGKRPFDADCRQKMLDRQEAARITSMTALAADIDPAIDKIIRSCLEPDPAKRPASAERLEEALRHSEARFRLMAKSFADMVIAYDMDQRLTFVNPAVQTLTGYTTADLENKQFICWVHPDDRERMLGHWDQLFQGRSFYDEEYRLIAKDGRVKWVAASWGPILDDAGEQVGVQGHEREVTERHVAEENLRFSEERYRSLFDHSPTPMREEDFSDVKRYLDGVHGAGLKERLTANRAELEECARRIRVVDVNRAACHSLWRQRQARTARRPRKVARRVRLQDFARRAGGTQYPDNVPHAIPDAHVCRLCRNSGKPGLIS
jgi:PAS domain S-box-containing protein